MIIYVATNRLNNMSYIGQTIYGLDKRKREHISLSKKDKINSYFCRSIRKHGPENFDWGILHDNITNINELNRLEIFYIGYYDTFKNGYNLTEGGGGNSGWVPSQETRDKLSEAHKGKKFSEEHKQRISENHADFSGKNHPLYGKVGKDSVWWGKKHSNKTKLNMSLAQRGKNNTFHGKHHTEAHKESVKERSKKPVILSGKFFHSMKEASKFIGIESSSLYYRMNHKTKWLDYEYVRK